jgi:hypothetical protein
MSSVHVKFKEIHERGLWNQQRLFEDQYSLPGHRKEDFRNSVAVYLGPDKSGNSSPHAAHKVFHLHCAWQGDTFNLSSQ